MHDAAIIEARTAQCSSGGPRNSCPATARRHRSERVDGPHRRSHTRHAGVLSDPRRPDPRTRPPARVRRRRGRGRLAGCLSREPMGPATRERQHRRGRARRFHAVSALDVAEPRSRPVPPLAAVGECRASAQMREWASTAWTCTVCIVPWPVSSSTWTRLIPVQRRGPVKGTHASTYSARTSSCTAMPPA